MSSQPEPADPYISATPPRRAKRLACAFAAASLLAVGVGCIAAKSAGVGAGVWGRNAAAWVIGAVVARLAVRIRPAPLFHTLLPLTLLALAASLFSSGLSGVHRWISTGPLTWNVSFLLLPAATVASVATTNRGPRWMRWVPFAIQLELCLQPDASQATAFAAALIFTHLTTRSPVRARLAASLFFVFTAVFAWTRLDPLLPIPEVEGILKLAAAAFHGLAALCVVLLTAVAASPLLARSHAHAGTDRPAIALSVYFLGCVSMPLFGAFPVPLVGMSMSPIIGFWLGTAALIAAG